MCRCKASMFILMAFDLFQCFLCLHVKCSDIRARWDWAVRIDPTHCDRSKGCIPQKSRESPSTFSKYIPIELIPPFAVLACFAQSEGHPSSEMCKFQYHFYVHRQNERNPWAKDTVILLWNPPIGHVSCWSVSNLTQRRTTAASRRRLKCEERADELQLVRWV